MRRIEARGQAAVAEAVARLAERAAEALPELAVTAGAGAVTVAGRGLALRRIGDARLRGLGLLARGEA